MIDAPFCPWPWFHQNILTDGGVNPCCVWGGSVKRYDRSDFFDGDFMSSLRQNFKDQIPHERCQKCLRNEQIKGRSHRTYGFSIAELLQIDFNSSPVLRSEEINLSNVCNIKCRSCNQERSTKWIPDAVALGEDPVGLLNSSWELTQTQAKNIKRLQFLGGEPLLHQDEIIRSLHCIKEHGDITNLIFFINSNITVSISNELLELMKMMKKVNIACSIDGVGTLNDYIRSDSTWQLVRDNLTIIRQLKQNSHNINFNLVCVYSVYNAHAFIDILDLATELDVWINPIFLRVPVHLDARNLPLSYKEKLISMYQSCSVYDSQISQIIGHLGSNGTLSEDDWLEKFSKFNSLLDQRRGVNLADVVPALDALLHKHK